MTKIFTLIALVFGLATAAQAQVISRLIGQARLHYDTNGYEPHDSSTYNYSYSRGSDMQTGLYLYDTSFYYLNTGAGLAEAMRYIRTYDGPTGARVISETSAMKTGTNWVNHLRETYHYPAIFGPNNADKKDTVLREAWNSHTGNWHPLTRTSTAYNNNGNVEQILIEQYDEILGTWANLSKTRHTYSGTNLVHTLKEEWNRFTNNWANVEQREYTFSGNFPLRDSLQLWDSASAIWVNQVKNHHTHNVSGQHTSLTQFIWDVNTGAWKTERRNQYEYTNNLITSDTLSSWDATNMEWVQNWLYTYSYTAAGNLEKATTLSPGPDSFLYYRMDEWAYNSYDQPEKFQAMKWNFTDSTWVQRDGNNVLQNFHYELFNVHVAERPYTLANIKLFPVPATSYIQLSFEQEKPGPIQIVIYDTQGRSVRHISGHAGMSYKRTLPLSNLPAGHYRLLLRTDTKQASKPFVIVK